MPHFTHVSHFGSSALVLFGLMGSCPSERPFIVFVLPEYETEIPKEVGG